MADVRDRRTEQGESGRWKRFRRVLKTQLPPIAIGASLALFLPSSHARVSSAVSTFVVVRTGLTAGWGGGGLLARDATGSCRSVASAAHLAVRRTRLAHRCPASPFDAPENCKTQWCGRGDAGVCRGAGRRRLSSLRLEAATGGAGTATSIDDLDLEQFEDLSGGRSTCLKKIEEPGDESAGNPSTGSKVTVHYAMRILGGVELSSSRDQEGGKPFQFNLGKWPSEAMHGWDKAVSTMRLGEIATLVCGPQYAFGTKGAPPKIPPNATIETRLELVDWMDLAATYNAKPGVTETDSEIMARWKEGLADGTSPMREEAGLDKRVRDEVAAKSKASPDGLTDDTGRKIYDVKSKEAQQILAKQKVQGFTRNFGYVERTGYLDLYIPVPKGTRAKKVTCEIHPGSMKLTVEGVGVVTEGEFEGKVSLDGCYWSITDLSLDPPPNVQDKTTTDEMRQGPVHRGETSVQVFLEKRKPFNTLWRDVFKEEDSDLGKPVLDVDTIHGGR